MVLTWDLGVCSFSRSYVWYP